jgi:SWIM zinc finger
MSNFKDNLGGIFIPAHLLELAEKYVPDVKSDQAGKLDPGPDNWMVVRTFNSSGTGKPGVHRVERKGNELRCTCQGFKIQKKGYCKHTKQVALELGI